MSERGSSGAREGSLDAPTRHALGWQSPAFWDGSALEAEVERVFDICHGCRRCFSLCNAFPVLFDHVDETPTGEVAAVPQAARWEVVDHCYLCDMCYMSKCPYVPPHPWNVDFPHLMLRAKAVKNRERGVPLRDRLLSSTDVVGRIAGIPVVREIVNATNRSRGGRRLVERAFGVHRDAPLPAFHPPFRGREARRAKPDLEAVPAAGTRGRVALFVTCYGNRNEPGIVDDLVAVLEHNGIPVALSREERCCGMPKLELGDLDAVARLKEKNIPALAAMVASGHDILAAIPSCVLMLKQELPLLFPDDPEVRAVAEHAFDPFEYLMLRHSEGLLRTDFSAALGKVAYHVPCHLRVQAIGQKTRELLALVPGTQLTTIERCSGHDGTYAVKHEFREVSMKIAKPVVDRVAAAGADHFASDCPMAAAQIASGLPDGPAPEHPLGLLRLAYGI
ncbi:MAG TPA: heterodisulfide reductase-related iron-sulfur binding cluster [Steroidobacteraceae bacterium]|nr:heterodisulfide reductase-related iron-sulfur binding cluster [Steroidobacteraceae bacterium]